MKCYATKNAKLRLQCLCELYALYGETVGGGGCRDNPVFEKQVCTSANQLPVLYLILRAGAGVDAGVGRAYGVRDF